MQEPGDPADEGGRIAGRVSSDRMDSEARWLVPSIGPLAAAERAQTVDVLARAFRDNPLNVAVVGARDPERRILFCILPQDSLGNIHGHSSF